MTDWLPFLIRWIHLIAGISWIGNSFYFMWMDSSFEPPKEPRPGVEGELYMVHGGHFYHVEKQKMRPGFIPQTLHWFKWEATLTWLSGFVLLILLYYMTDGIYLIEPGSPIQSPLMASLMSLGFIFGSWFIYDLFWHSSFAEKFKPWATALSLLAVGFLCWILCHIFTGRGAFLHLGTIFATCMVLNVWIRILPGQRAMLKDAQAGLIPNYDSGIKAKWRSTHNSYMTLPVLFSMISNHFSLAYGHSYNWVILILLCVLGAVVRHMMIQWNKGKSGLVFLIPIVGVIAVMIFLTSQKKLAWTTNGPAVSFSQVQAILNQRCVSCHSAHPTDDVFKAPPNGISFEDPLTIKNLAARIHERVWITKNMPLANKTLMTDPERELLAQWVESGAPIK